MPKKGINGIVSCPRPGGYYDAIVPYLKSRAKDLAGLTDEDIHVDNAHNIYFDIPATSGFEDADMIILQGHSDMIVAGLTDEQAKATSIDAVIENGTIHSRNYKTSLGADDGAGIAIALTILKNRDKFNHGPIRFLMTADEDIGMVGAKALDSSWLKYNGDYIKWLMNIDAEEEGYVYRSCAGNSRYTFSCSYDKSSESSLSYEYTLHLDGLLGGHSAIDIVKNRGNADRIVYEFLYYLVNEQKAKIQIVSHNHEKVIEGELKNLNYGANQIIANSKIVFKSDLAQQSMIGYWKNMIQTWKDGSKYNFDDWENIESSSELSLNTKTSAEFISKTDSNTLISAMGNYNINPTESLDSFYYGVLEYFPGEEYRPKASINLGPVSIEYDSTSSEFIYQSQASTRSGVGTEESKEQYSIKWLVQQYQKVSDQFGLTMQQGAFYYPWVKEENNKLVELLADGYQKFGITPIICDALGGVEPAIWMEKSDENLTCLCIGVKTDDVHSVKETLYINTIEPCVKNLINAIEELANKK